MKYRVIVAPSAAREARAIHSWLGERSIAGATAWSSALNSALERLKSNPTGCVLASENDDAPIEIREFSFKTRRGRRYRGIFEIQYDVVHVLHIRGPGQELLRPEEFDE